MVWQVIIVIVACFCAAPIYLNPYMHMRTHMYIRTPFGRKLRHFAVFCFWTVSAYSVLLPMWFISVAVVVVAAIVHVNLYLFRLSQELLHLLNLLKLNCIGFSARPCWRSWCAAMTPGKISSVNTRCNSRGNTQQKAKTQQQLLEWGEIAWEYFAI